MKKKRFYEKPSMKVVELQQRSMLLAGSGGGGFGDGPQYPELL